MRILFVGLHPPHTGGIATATFYLKKHLEKLGHTVFVLNYDFPKGRLSGIRFFFKALRNRSIIKKENIDIIHAHYLVPPGLSGLVLKWIWGKPLVTSAHGSDVNILARNFLGWILCRLVVRFTDALIANSQATQKRLSELGGKSEVIYLGIDRKRFFPREEKREAILYVGALTGNKCVSDLIEAFHDKKIWIVGDGPERGNLERLAKQMNCDCTFFGYRQDVEDFMSRALALVLPSRKEGFGLTVIEALACGTPVLARKGSGVEEILDSRFLFETKDEMRNLLERIIEGDPFLKTSGAEILKFDWDMTAEKTEKIYREALEKR